jgi:hypothetical protein
MWLEAVFSKGDFVLLAEELLPLTIHLGHPVTADHYVQLNGPADVSLVEGKGLRLACKAQVRWPVLGIDIPVNVDSLTVLLEPSVATTLGEDEAVFKLEIESADVAWVPALVDRGIVHSINEALNKKGAELHWQFAKTLSHVFGMPEFLQPLHALSLKVAWGKVRTTEEAVAFAVSFHTRAIRQDEALPEPAAPPNEDRERPPGRALARREPAPRATVAVGTLLALVTGSMAFWGIYRWLAHPGLGRRRSAW